MALTAGAADAGPGETDGPSEREDVPDGVPGAGETVRVARPTWDTGWFQAEILSQLPVDPGYSIDGPRTMGNEEFYAGLADESVDVWLNGWFPLHQLLVDELAPDAAQAIGFEVRGGALQGRPQDPDRRDA
jgi:glycine betaine/proline transport system substrate-binding protein